VPDAPNAPALQRCLTCGQKVERARIKSQLRRRALRFILAQTAPPTQAEILALLKALGYPATQRVLSADLALLGARKEAATGTWTLEPEGEDR